MEIPFEDRLKCPHSYGSEDSPDLLCDYDFCGKCTGTLWEHCMWDMPLDKQREIWYELGKEVAQ